MCGGCVFIAAGLLLCFFCFLLGWALTPILKETQRSFNPNLTTGYYKVCRGDSTKTNRAGAEKKEIVNRESFPSSQSLAVFVKILHNIGI